MALRNLQENNKKFVKCFKEVLKKFVRSSCEVCKKFMRSSQMFAISSKEAGKKFLRGF